MKGIRAVHNGVTGHEIAPPDFGQVIPEAMQRAKHLALRAITGPPLANASSSATLEGDREGDRDRA